MIAVNKTIWLHLLAWAIFILYEISFLIALKTSFKIYELFAFYILNICLFYFNAHFVLSRANVTRKYYRLIFYIPVELLVYIFLGIELQKLFHYIDNDPAPVKITSIVYIQYSWRGLYFLLFSGAYWLTLFTVEKNKRISQLEMMQLTSEKKESELQVKLAKTHNDYLRSQIDPHLLFNSLNFIYNSIEEVSTEASECVLLLAEIMHYILNKTEEDEKADLCDEIEQIKKLIRLNQIRFKKNLNLIVTNNIDNNTQQRVLPLLLMTFIENMFKHGDLTDSKYPGEILFDLDNGRLHFKTHNKKRSGAKSLGQQIGIENAKSRLENAYTSQQYDLTISNKRDNFTVDLLIQLI